MTGNRGGWPGAGGHLPHLLANSFGSHMVLQHQSPCLWGFGAAGAAVTLSLNGSVAAAASSSVAANGSWFACLPAQPLPEPAGQRTCLPAHPLPVNYW